MLPVWSEVIDFIILFHIYSIPKFINDSSINSVAFKSKCTEVGEREWGYVGSSIEMVGPCRKLTGRHVTFTPHWWLDGYIDMECLMLSISLSEKLRVEEKLRGAFPLLQLPWGFSPQTSCQFPWELWNSLRLWNRPAYQGGQGVECLHSSQLCLPQAHFPYCRIQKT